MWRLKFPNRFGWLLCAVLPTHALADMDIIGGACAEFMRVGDAAFEGWNSAPCRGSSCSSLVETTIRTAPGDMGGWVVQTGAPENGPLAGQRRCEVIEYPDISPEDLHDDADDWIEMKISEGFFRTEERFTFGCGAGDQSFAVGNLLVEKSWVFTMMQIPVHPPCS